MPKQSVTSGCASLRTFIWGRHSGGQGTRVWQPSPRAGIALIEGAPPGERFGMAGLPAVMTRLLLAMALSEQGAFAQAIAAGEEGLRRARTAGHPYSEVYGCLAIGYTHLRRGDFAAATRVLEPALALCREMEIRIALPLVATFLGSAYLWSGRTSDAVPLLEEAIEVLTAMRILGLRSWFITFLTEAYLVLGRIAEGYGELETARADYLRVIPPAEDEPQGGSTYLLAKRRLERLPKN